MCRTPIIIEYFLVQNKWKYETIYVYNVVCMCLWVQICQKIQVQIHTYYYIYVCMYVRFCVFTFIISSSSERQKDSVPLFFDNFLSFPIFSWVLLLVNFHSITLVNLGLSRISAKFCKKQVIYSVKKIIFAMNI